MHSANSSLKIDVQALKIERTALRKDLKESREEAESLHKKVKEDTAEIQRINREAAQMKAAAAKEQQKWEALVTAKDKEWAEKV